MNIFYIYLALLLLIFILLYYGVEYSLKFAPIKIKAVCSIVLTAVSLRYIALIILLIWKNIKYLYLLKPLVYLNLFCIPALAVISLYILARNDKLKLNYCLIFASLMLIFYIIVVTVLPVSITSLHNLGYIMLLQRSDLIYGIYIVINTIILFAAVLLLGYNNTNKIGMTMVLICAAVQISELLVRACGINLLPAILIGDLCWITIGVYSLYKLRK